MLFGHTMPMCSKSFQIDVTLGCSQLIARPDSRKISLIADLLRSWHEVGHWLSDCGLQQAQSFHVAGPFPIVFAQKEE
jgi:hypothetical protein